MTNVPKYRVKSENLYVSVDSPDLNRVSFIKKIFINCLVVESLNNATVSTKHVNIFIK